MVSANDPLESFFNSIESVKGALSPLESGIRKAAKDIECCWLGHKNRFKNVELVTQLNGGDRNGKVQMCAVKKKNGQNAQCEVTDERKKGLSIRVPIKMFLGKFSSGCGNNGHKTDVSKREVKGKDFGKEDGDCMNCLQFAVTWSLLVNSFVQGFSSPFKMGKKRFQKMVDEDRDKKCLNSRVQGLNSRVSCEVKGREMKGKVAGGFQNEGLMPKEGKLISLECLIGFIFDQLIHNLQKFDQGVQESSHKSCDTSSPLTNDHLKAVTSIFEDRKA
ncbi:hypothetical protein L1049_011439 [Liquidambar formosana]|uniref:Uncharacterized protein n=1 Tax=Liquidambar formosana TaxID=63359 RepID=A0AAP0RRG5_LIQFO